MRQYLVELIGTFFLVLAIGLAIRLPDAALVAPLAIGAVLTAMIYAGGHISFAHYNPAVTLAFWMCGRCAPKDTAGYVAAQLIGAVLAIAAVARFDAAAVTRVAVGGVDLFLAEILFTFALCWVILNVALAKATGGNSFYGAAIGLLVTGGAYVVGPVTGAAFNPAVTVALCLTGLTSWSQLPLYFAAQFAGAALAALAFKYAAE